ncbi:MAG: hypothetical protein M3Q48_04135 [Actinomycetota bacterium]|nr:hypothetical protein [Actinomycetota bacterium]
MRFWLDYAERHGALFEDHGDCVALLLPDGLRQRHRLPEEVTVTADPDVARHDDALLLAPGQPVLEDAADDVLSAGDVGVVALGWPRSVPPSAEVLEARAREQIPVAHGRIDAAGAPGRALLPVLRVGALITYSVSLDERFQEREEAWVDATTGCPLPDDVAAGVASCPPSDGEAAGPRMPGDVDTAAAAAARHLAARGEPRLAELGRQAQRACHEELARAEAYYAAALAAIGRRRAGAPPERARMLDAQAEATRIERSRRLAEIEEKFGPRLAVRPFRMHLVLVPALRLPVVVRRGTRSYPLTLSWLLWARCFAPLPCPSCRSITPLNAGRHRLGCHACLR